MLLLPPLWLTLLLVCVVDHDDVAPSGEPRRQQPSSSPHATLVFCKLLPRWGTVSGVPREGTKLCWGCVGDSRKSEATKQWRGYWLCDSQPASQPFFAVLRRWSPLCNGSACINASSFASIALSPQAPQAVSQEREKMPRGGTVMRKGGGEGAPNFNFGSGGVF